MANKSVYLDKKELATIMQKLEGLGVMAEDFDKELKQTTQSMKEKIKQDFDAKSLPHLERRGEDTKGLSSSIRMTTLSRKKGVGSAYKISAGGLGKKLMAYIEFGTRRRTISLGGVTAVLGGAGSDYALQFKGGDSRKNFTNLSARPYFFHNVFVEKKKMMKRLGMRVNKILKKK
ncbi:MAG: hypothetical protein JKX82_07850 [Oleispira sp.]|nr:hypothetical protein [Oleispira sp.]